MFVLLRELRWTKNCGEELVAATKEKFEHSVMTLVVVCGGCVRRQGGNAIHCVVVSFIQYSRMILPPAFRSKDKIKKNKKKIKKIKGAKPNKQ